jgi:hypothetical protein
VRDLVIAENDSGLILGLNDKKAKAVDGMAAAGFALLTVPLLSFVSAGMFEFQRDLTSLRSLTRMLPLAVAGVLSILLLIKVYDPYFSVRRVQLSRPMSTLSLLVALVCRYKSRLTSALIVIGGLALAFFWLMTLDPMP